MVKTKKGKKRSVIIEQDSPQKPEIAPKVRLHSLDALRGFAVLLMISTHIIISFFWDSNNIPLKVISYIGGYLSFSLFLLVSGFIVGHLQEKLSLLKIAKRSANLLLAYFLLGFLYTQLNDKDILSLFTAPIFLEEYLIPLAIFPFIGYIFVHLIKRIRGVKKLLMSQFGGFLVVLFGILLAYLGKIAAPWSNSFFTSIFLGSETLHTFPILSYAIVYGIGMWLGWSYKAETPKNYIVESLSIIFVSILVAFGSLFFEKIYLDINTLDAIRWPPTVFFITSGLAVSLIIMTFLLHVGTEWKTWFIPLPVIGKYALQLFVLHLLFIYAVEYYLVWRIPFEQRTPAPTVAPLPTLPVQEQYYLRLEEPTYKHTWPFKQDRVAYLPITDASKNGTRVHVSIVPREAQTSAVLAGATIYSLNAGNTVTEVPYALAAVSQAASTITFVIPKDSTSIFVGLPNTHNTVTPTDMYKLIANPNKTIGSSFGTINKDFTAWIVRPYATNSRSWFVKDPSTQKKQLQTMSIAIPLTCDELEQYERLLATQISLSEGGGTVELQTCTSLSTRAAVPTLPFTYAESQISFTPKTNLFELKEGEHTLTFTLTIPTPYIDKTLEVVSSRVVLVSAPYYIIWSLDWEGFYVPQESFDHIEKIRKNNPALTISHMFNPRAWNSTQVSSYNANTQITFVKNGAKNYNDEIALHMHMFTDLVTASGVTPLTINGWSNRKDGYDIPTSSYSYEELNKIFAFAVSAFKAKGLPAPVSYRAGGWFASTDVFKAAKDNGILIDSSGRTSYTSSSFGNGTRYTGPWNLSATAQPYWVSQTNINTASGSKAASIGIYEMPNNGGDSWAFSKETMVGRFTSLFPKSILTGRKVTTYLSHPEFFKTEGPKIEQVLATTSLYVADADYGPVVYTTLKDYAEMYAK